MLALTSSRCAAFSAPVRVQPRQVLCPAPGRTALVVEAAVPKKKTSKSKKNIRRAAWKKEVLPYVEQALFKAKLALKEGNRDSADKDLVVGGSGAAAEQGGSAAAAEEQ